ncbi:putative elongator complex protein 1 [Lucilia cuprina]|uniref:putative elongator complex protein 1 n=1 Tax=Lucilia cuprina TaxID=7375 RepID=UPI001F06E4F7|nr:putative elongator complex protein 1 [Lucilia cuprina]
MRNLKLKYNQQYTQGIAQAKCLLINPNSGKSDDNRFVVTDDKLFLYKPGSTEPPKVLAEVPDIVAAEYLALENEICLATSVGEVLLVNPDNLQVNEGTFCDVGIECMSWSPDQEVVVFVTKHHNVVVMTCTYDPLAEHSLSDENAEAEGEFVNVGWGKKETQFHGSEGKQAAKQNLDDGTKVNVEELPQDIHVDWRADGAYFVVSYVSSAKGRTFKVFDKEGKLQYVAEKQPNLSPAVSWRPSGNWIALPQRLPNKSCIALFEKNGLRHRELVLPFDLQNEPVESIKWSSDSEILCLKTQHKLYLYTIGNYHWYLKQVLEFSIENQINYLIWDNRIGEEKTLHLLFENGKYLVYKWHWSIDRFNRSGLVCVVDGKRLLLTDFSKAVIPPPMCSQELLLENEAFIAAICLQGVQEDLQLCIYDSKHNIHLFKAKVTAPTKFTKLGVLKSLESPDSLQPLQYANLQWFESFEDTYLLAYNTRDNVSALKFFSLDLTQNCFKAVSTVNIAGTVYTLAPSGREQPCELFYQLMDDCRLMQLVFDVDSNRETSRRLHAEFENLIEQLETFIRPLEAETFTIALTINQVLFINTQRSAQDVTSFCMAGNYLTFTKLASLHFLRLSDLCLVNERRLERGSKLITTVSQSARTVLQMPRGNLEAICPRVLSLELVGALLESQKYCLAFDMLRKQRINLNILCDHNMCDFVNRLDVFLQEIQNPNWLNLFLSDLQNEDFTKTMYSSNYKENSQTYPEDFKIENKVLYLCKALCARMEQSSEKRYRLPILTAYVKMGELEKALELIWQDKRNDNNTDGSGTAAAEDALKYLLYLVDVNELYNVALGTYDFGLVLFVAQKSQKDPKEYLAFLNELKSYELNYRKFKIDEHLKRFAKALKHIANCGKEKFDEALAFIKKHEYYAQALRAYREDEDCYREICLAFADYLRGKGKFENASILYERGLNMQQALLSAKHVLDWQRVLMLAKKIDPESVATVANSLISPLQEQGKHLEAFELAKKYSNNFTSALECLFAGKLFLTAIYEINVNEDGDQKEELLQNLLIPKLLAYHEILSNNLAADQAEFIKHKARLLEVRIERSKQAQNLVDGNDQIDIDECDLLSDTTSLRSSRYTASSRGTGKTFRSSKNRRKHERKLLSFKPGNPFEDIAYISALYTQITKCFNQQQHIHDTCKALVLCNKENEATDLQQQLKVLLRLMQDSLDDIWIPEMLSVTAAQQFIQGPNFDYTQLQNEQRYAMLDPIKRFKPQLNIIDWEHEILQL